MPFQRSNYLLHSVRRTCSLKPVLMAHHETDVEESTRQLLAIWLKLLLACLLLTLRCWAQQLVRCSFSSFGVYAHNMYVALALWLIWGLCNCSCNGSLTVDVCAWLPWNWRSKISMMLLTDCIAGYTNLAHGKMYEISLRRLCRTGTDCGMWLLCACVLW